MNSKVSMIGGCLCGDVRYQIDGPLIAAEYCHCRMCQKHAGSPVATWMDINTEHFRWSKSAVKEYKSSKSIRRGFCGLCGSTLSFRSTEHPEYITLSITSLDDPDKVIPTYHIYTSSTLKWFRIADECKRYPENKK